MANFTNITNDSVIGQLAHHFTPFVPQVFGRDSSGSIFFGLVILMLFLGVCMYLRLSLDVVLAVMFPLVLLLYAYGIFPWYVAGTAVIIAVGIIIFAVIGITNRR